MTKKVKYFLVLFITFFTVSGSISKCYAMNKYEVSNGSAGGVGIKAEVGANGKSYWVTAWTTATCDIRFVGNAYYGDDGKSIEFQGSQISYLNFNRMAPEDLTFVGSSVIVLTDSNDTWSDYLVIY